MTDVERLNDKLSLIRGKIKKNDRSLSGKITPNKSKRLEKENDKLKNQEQGLLSDIQKAVKKSEKDQKKAVKGLKSKITAMGHENDSLQRQIPEEVSDLMDNI